MRIVHILEPFATGINTFIHELVFSMPDYEHVIIHGERKENRKIEEIKLEYEGRATFIKWENAHREISLIKDLKAFFELKKILKNIQFDIIHLHSSKAGIIGRLIGYFDGYKKIVYTPNAASFLRTDISKKKKHFYKRLEKFANNKNTTIISSSKSESEEYDKIGITTKIIQNGVTLPLIKKNDSSKRSSIFKVVFCGKITIQKNPTLFNEIAKHYVNDPSISFTWIGGGDSKEILSSGNLKITGWCSKEDVYETLKQSNLFLSASSWEGLSLSAIEALAFGLPLVLNRCFGNEDIVSEGVNGFLFDSKEKAIEYIDYIRNNPEKYKELSNQSRKTYENNYGNYRCGLEYKELYASLIDSKQ